MSAFARTSSVCDFHKSVLEMSRRVRRNFNMYNATNNGTTINAAINPMMGVSSVI
jgi:hypothetical protein